MTELIIMLYQDRHRHVFPLQEVAGWWGTYRREYVFMQQPEGYFFTGDWMSDGISYRQTVLYFKDYNR